MRLRCDSLVHYDYKYKRLLPSADDLPTRSQPSKHLHQHTSLTTVRLNALPSLDPERTHRELIRPGPDA